MSRKEKEVVVRLSERDLRAVEYIREFLEREDLEETKEGEKEEVHTTKHNNKRSAGMGF